MEEEIFYSFDIFLPSCHIHNGHRIASPMACIFITTGNTTTTTTTTTTTITTTNTTAPTQTH